MTLRPPDLPQLTGIRALAAGWVVLFHGDRIVRGLFPDFVLAEPFVKAGYLGVDLFFVLSGFIIAYNYLDRPGPSQSGSLSFLKARLARLYPVHLFTLAVVVAGYYGAGLVGRTYGAPAQHRPDQLLLHLFLLHDWVWAAETSWNLPSWSISAEWFAYLGFLAIAPLVARIRSRQLALGLAVVGYAVLTLALGAHEPGTLDVTTQGGLIRVSCEFAAGCLLAQFHRLSPEASRWWHAATLSIAAAIVAALWWGWADGAVAALFGAFVLALARSEGLATKLLSHRSVVYGGQISYALYMTHGIVLHLYASLVGPERFAEASLAVRVGALIGLCAALWLAADLTFRLVEEPGRKWIRRWRLPARKTSGPGPRPSAAPAPQAP